MIQRVSQHSKKTQLKKCLLERRVIPVLKGAIFVSAQQTYFKYASSLKQTRVIVRMFAQ